MKINEIIQVQEAPGIFGKLRNAIGKKENSMFINNFAKKAVPAWINYLNQLEAKNGYEELNATQVKNALQQWFDATVLQPYTVQSAPQDIKAMYQSLVDPLVQNPREKGLVQKAVAGLLAVSQARSGQDELDGTAPTNNRQSTLAPQQDCKVSANSGKITVCGQEVDRNSQTYRDLEKLLKAQGQA